MSRIDIGSLAPFFPFLHKFILRWNYQTKQPSSFLQVIAHPATKLILCKYLYYLLTSQINFMFSIENSLKIQYFLFPHDNLPPSNSLIFILPRVPSFKAKFSSCCFFKLHGQDIYVTPLNPWGTVSIINLIFVVPSLCWSGCLYLLFSMRYFIVFNLC